MSIGRGTKRRPKSKQVNRNNGHPGIGTAFCMADKLFSTKSVRTKRMRENRVRNKDLLIGKIELRKYDALIPFVCHRCGACCHNFVPQIWAEDLPKIARYLKRPREKTKIQHEECYRKKFTTKPVDCSFLSEKNQCMIYPLRPEGCRLYPFTDFGACGVDCPGHKEFYRVVDAFFARREYAALWSPGSPYNHSIRSVPDREWPTLLRKFTKAQPSNGMAQKFFNINEVPRQFLKEVVSVAEVRSGFAGKSMEGSISPKQRKEVDPINLSKQSTKRK